MASSLIDLVDKVGAYYETAWLHLWYLTTLLVTVGVVVIPLLIQWAQFRLAKREEERIRALVKDEEERLRVGIKQEIAAAANAQESLITRRLAEATTSLERAQTVLGDELRAEIGKLQKTANARVLHLQSMLYGPQGRLADCVASSVRAAEDYLAVDDQANLQAVLRNLTLDLPKLFKEDFEVTTPDQGIDLNEFFTNFLGKLDKANTHGQYSMCTRDLRRELALSKARKRPVSPKP